MRTAARLLRWTPRIRRAVAAQGKVMYTHTSFHLTHAHLRAAFVPALCQPPSPSYASVRHSRAERYRVLHSVAHWDFTRLHPPQAAVGYIPAGTLSGVFLNPAQNPSRICTFIRRELV